MGSVCVCGRVLTASMSAAPDSSSASRSSSSTMRLYSTNWPAMVLSRMRMNREVDRQQDRQCAVEGLASHTTFVIQNTKYRHCHSHHYTALCCTVPAAALNLSARSSASKCVTEAIPRSDRAAQNSSAVMRPTLVESYLQIRPGGW
jgi:hypothetical protein